jgi:hypothetical protein
MQPPDHFPDDLPKTLELHRALAPKMASCVTPIAESVAGETYQLGTGTFFRVADFSFLVTAAHVLREGIKHNALLRILDGASANEPVKYRDVALPKWTAYVGEFPADVAIVPLTDDIVAALPNRCFLRLDEVALRPAYPGGCWVMGFPADTVTYTESGRKITYSPFLLAAPLVERKSSLENFNKDFHFLLNARRDELWWPGGTPAEMPDQLGGISGCPVWQVAWPDGRWQPEHVRIVGVQTAYYRKRSLVKATYWGAVAAVLHAHCPELRGILDMHLGSRHW